MANHKGTTKICGACKLEKDLSCFCQDKRARDGLYYQCRTCNSSRLKSYRSTGKEKRNTYMTSYRKTKRGLIAIIFGNQKISSKATSKVLDGL